MPKFWLLPCCIIGIFYSLSQTDMYRDPNLAVEYLPSLQPLSPDAFTCLSNVRLIATDMDGTLTKQGKFSAALLQALENLTDVDIKVLIVTGRSAGWVSGLSSLMPVVGAIAENGGLFYPSGSEQPMILTPIPDLVEHRKHLGLIFEQLKSEFPQLQESGDNRFRLTDWTFDVAGLSLDELLIMRNLCQTMDWGFTYSNVQCHIKPQRQEKAIALLQVLQEYFPDYSPAQVVTVGDSPNDESLFNQRYFPVSVGVANVMKYVTQLQYQPRYVTTAAEGEGFCELSGLILRLKKNSGVRINE